MLCSSLHAILMGEEIIIVKIIIFYSYADAVQSKLLPDLLIFDYLQSTGRQMKRISAF